MATILSAIEPGRASTEKDDSRLRVGLEGALVFALALALPLFWVGHRPHFDELYHLLAAQGLLAEGEPAIAGGTYLRGYLFTQMVAWSLWLFGPTIEAARLPTLFTFGVLATVLFLWIRAGAGRLAGFVTVGLLLLSPLAIDIGYMARFYALHTLLFLIAAWCIWRLGSADDRPWFRVVLVVLALPVMLVALDLHALTLIHLGGAFLWLAAAAALRLVSAGRGRLVVLALVLAAVVAAGALWLGGERLLPLLDQYRSAPAWAADNRDEIAFYHLRLMHTYPLFWLLTPLAVYLAFRARPVFTGFAFLIFTTAFILLSFGGMKSDRYLFGPKLFLFAIWALAFARAWPWLGRGSSWLIERIRPRLPRALPDGLVRLSLAGAAVLLMLAVSIDPLKAVYAYAKGSLPHAPGRNVIAPEWPHAAGPLASWLDQAEIVMTSDELSALHFLGRADVIVSRTRHSEVGNGEFARDPRTGLLVTSSADGVGTLVACHRSGLAVIPAFDFEAGWTIPAATATRIRELMQPVVLDGLPGLRVFHFENPAPAPCPRVPGSAAR